MMHVGRIAHPFNQPAGARIVAPSAIAAQGVMWTDQAGKQPMPTPEEMTVKDIHSTIREYAEATEYARRAGFDGVELHAANGYLPNQFLSPNANHRTDEYGGSVERRSRLVLELFDAMSAAWSPRNIGVRISPGTAFNDILDTESRAIYSHLAQQLSARRAAYLHVIRPAQFTPADAAFDVWAVLRREFSGTFIAVDSVSPEEGSRLIETRAADLVAFGRPFIANPDLPARLANKWPLTEPNVGLLYTAGAEGYIDYPVYEPETALAAA
jgi:N-ethylmaleimide reductase